VVGILEEVACHLGHRFTTAGDRVLMVQTGAPSLAASEYEALFGTAHEALSAIDLERERRLVEGLIAAARRGLIRSAHDVSDGGLAVALAEACFDRAARLGCAVEQIGETAADLFGEGASTVILSAAPQNLDAIREIFAPLEVTTIGRVTPTPRLKIIHLIDEDVAELMRLYEEALPRTLGAP
jgi:phosphoribosylformylglycinamidine (FGAM) synthase-like enzyme